MMDALSFDPRAIAATTAVGGLITAPLVPLIGALSDRLGRRLVLVGTYLLIAAASVVLAIADQFWQFSLAAALLSLGFAVGGSVSAALAGDLIAATALPNTLGRLSTVTWIGAVIAFGGGGALLGSMQVPSLCLLAALLAVSAGLMVALIRTTHASVGEATIRQRVSHGHGK
jgi:MFS family permease